MSDQEIRREYPHLEPEDLQAALAYAASVLALEDVFPIAASPLRAIVRVLVGESTGAAVVA